VTSECHDGAVACGGGEGGSVLATEPVSVVLEVRQEDVFLIMACVASEGTEMIMDCRQGSEGGGLVRVVFWLAPNKVVNGDGFVRHESAQIREEGLVVRTDA
jgi:hypothetical protein